MPVDRSKFADMTAHFFRDEPGGQIMFWCSNKERGQTVDAPVGPDDAKNYPREYRAFLAAEAVAELANKAADELEAAAVAADEQAAADVAPTGEIAPE